MQPRDDGLSVLMLEAIFSTHLLSIAIETLQWIYVARLHIGSRWKAAFNGLKPNGTRSGCNT